MYQTNFDFISPDKPTLSKNGELTYVNSFLPFMKAQQLFETLQQKIEWRQDKIQIYGKLIPQPRLTAWYGDQNAIYSYSKIVMAPTTWLPELLTIKNDLEHCTQTTYNSVLINLYRSGDDHVSWHSDNEKELGINPTIASLSLGETRTFHLKHKTDHDLKTISVDLVTGSLLVMKGEMQNYWLHRISPSKKMLGPRMNLTFRKIFN